MKMDTGEMALYGLAAMYAVKEGVFAAAQARRMAHDGSALAWLHYLLPAPPDPYRATRETLDDKADEDAHARQF